MIAYADHSAIEQGYEPQHLLVFIGGHADGHRELWPARSHHVVTKPVPSVYSSSDFITGKKPPAVVRSVNYVEVRRLCDRHGLLIHVEMAPERTA